MAPHMWSHLGDTVSDDKYRMYYRGQRIKEAYYRGEKIWGEALNEWDNPNNVQEIFLTGSDYRNYSFTGATKNAIIDAFSSAIKFDNVPFPIFLVYREYSNERSNDGITYEVHKEDRYVYVEPNNSSWIYDSVVFEPGTKKFIQYNNSSIYIGRYQYNVYARRLKRYKDASGRFTANFGAYPIYSGYFGNPSVLYNYPGNPESVKQYDMRTTGPI